TSDGKTHCVPPGQRYYDASIFVDPECKRPLAMVPKAEYAPVYVGRPPCPDGFMHESLTDSDAFAVHPVGAMVTLPTVYTLNGQMCGPRNPPELDALFEVLPELT